MKRRQVAGDRVVLIAGTMAGSPRRNEKPYKKMVPTLSEKYEDYEPLRDHIPCFPRELRRPIPVETDAGKQSADRALRALKISSTLDEMQFVNLWRGYERAVKMAKWAGHSESDQLRAEKMCVKAYHYIAGHIMAMHQEDYEKARVARVICYQAHVESCAKRGTAPPGEDNRQPIQPYLSTTATEGTVVSLVELTG